MIKGGMFLDPLSTFPENLDISLKSVHNLELFSQTDGQIKNSRHTMSVVKVTIE